MKKRWLEIVAHLAFWTLTTWVLVRMFAIEEQFIEVVNGVEQIHVSYNPVFQKILLLGQLFRAILFYGVLWLANRLNAGQFGLPKFWLLSLGALLLVFLSTQVLVMLFLLPHEMKLGYDLSFGIFTFYFAIAMAIGFTKGWVKKERDGQRLSLEKKEAELNLLRSQLHPHFLFNTLNNLLSMSQLSGDEKLSESIGRLSELLRFSLYETQGGSIPLDKEIAFVKHFAELNLIRFEEGEIDWKFMQEGETSGFTIEPGIFLPFVENAFKYGAMPEEPSFIHALLTITSSGKLFFSISNSKHDGLDIAPLNHGGIGLDNTRHRLELIYPNRHQLKIIDNQHFTIELTIYLHENNHR